MTDAAGDASDKPPLIDRDRVSEGLAQPVITRVKGLIAELERRTGLDREAACRATTLVGALRAPFGVWVAGGAAGDFRNLVANAIDVYKTA